jgi:toxin HigB-1
MIKTFGDRRLKRLYEKGDRSRVSPEMADKIENILGVLDRARRIEAMDLPGFRLHALKGDRAGYWSVTVRANWRVIFLSRTATPSRSS